MNLSLDILNPVKRIEATTLLQHVLENWDYLAKNDPYWASITDPVYHDGPCKTFWGGGYRGAVDIILDVVSAGMTPKRMTACELGSGVGRLTWPMSNLFKSVTGYDISPKMVEICKQHHPEIPCRLYTGSLPRNSFDLVYSALTLQHNPPLVIEALLEDMFRSASQAVWFQLTLPPVVPVSLNPPIPCIPMYGLTESEATEIGSKMGFTLASCLENDFGGECLGRQYTFLRNE